MGIVQFTQSAIVKAFYYYSTFLASVNVFGYLASLSEATPTGVFRSATAQRAALSAEMRWIRRRRRRRERCFGKKDTPPSLFASQKSSPLIEGAEAII